MPERLAGQVAIVTGAAQGIGAAIARRFTAEGAHVVALDRNAERLGELACELPSLLPFVADVQDHAALERGVAAALASYARIDILVNNAGFQYTVPLLDSTLEQWRCTQAVNLEPHYLLSKLVAPHMAHQSYGRIVNIASTQAIAAEPMVSAYAASKGGVVSLTRSLAVELAPYSIIVNAIAPGCIHTPMCVINGVDETQTPDFQEWYVRRRKIPLGRPGQADEIATVAVFLASAECSYVTGHTLVADGGLTITF
jgi:NAD(P)-dependent dehydrogenase (short-subunit alcohol dehydrogenase family)